MANIGIISNSLSGGGAERSSNLLANSLLSQGHKIFLVPINSGPADFVEPKCEIYPLGREWKSGVIPSIKALIRFRRTIKQLNPSHIILNCELPELFSIFVSSKTLKKIVIEHTTKPWNGRRLIGYIVRLILKIQNSSWVRVGSFIDPWPRNLIRDSELIPNLMVPAGGLSNSPEGSRLVFVGRFSPEKGPLKFLRFVEVTGVKGLMIGDGVLSSKIQESINTRKLGVSLTGQVENPWSFVTPNDIVIVPSEYEGDGLVVLEALQNNLALIVSRIPAFLRLELDAAQYCTDIEEFVSSIEECLQNPDKFRKHSVTTDLELSSRTENSVLSLWSKLI